MQKDRQNDNEDGIKPFFPKRTKVGRICPVCQCTIYYNKITYKGKIDEAGTPVGEWQMNISITEQKPIKFVVNQKDDNATFTGFVDSKTDMFIFGCYKYKDIYIYKGEWKDGKKNGMGEMLFVPKDPSNINEELIYNSFLNFNNPENIVVLFEDEAYRYYEIYDLNDKEKMNNILYLYFSGTRFTEGVKYVGGFKNNQMHGHGILSYDNKLIYDGQWDQSEKHRKGILYNQQGKIVYNGDWSWNVKEGYGEDFYHDENEEGYERYEGEFDEHLRDRNGKMYFKNGDTFDGTFHKGVTGYGVLETKEGGIYDGRLLYDDDGYLIVEDYQQTTIYKGECFKKLQPVITSQQKAITPVSTMLSPRGSEKMFPINKLINNFTSNLQMAKQNTLKMEKQNTQNNFKPPLPFRIKLIKNFTSTLKMEKQNTQNNSLPLFKIEEQSGSINRGQNTELFLKTNLLNLTIKPTNDLFKKTLQISRSKIQSRNGSIDNKPIDIGNKSKIFWQKPPLNPKKIQNVGEGIINQSASQNNINSRKGADTPKTFSWVEPPVNPKLPSRFFTRGVNSNLVNSARDGWTRE